MKKYFVSITIIVVTFALTGIFQACKKNDKDPTPINKEVPETTKVIDAQVWQNTFNGIDSANYTLLFDKGLLTEIPLEIGDIIVSSYGNGLLRKISKITETVEGLEIETEFAHLTEVVNEGQTTFSSLLSSQRIMKIKYHKKGVEVDTSLMKSTEDTQLEYDIDVFLDPSEKIHIQGDFSILTELNGQLKIGYIPPRVSLFELTYEIEQSLNLSANIELINLYYEHEVDLVSIYFQPIIALISGVPVVLVPELEMAVGIETEVYCDLYTGINQEMDYIVGIRYEDRDWSTINEFSKYFNYTPPYLDCNAGARAYIRPQFNILIYGVLSPYLYGDLYGKIEANINDNPWWNLYAGADLGVGVEAEILGKEIFDFNTNPPLISYEQLIASASASEPPLANFISNTNNGTAPLEVTFTDQSIGNPTSWQWDFGDGSTSTQANPTHTYTDNGSYTVSLTVINSYGSDTENKINFIIVSSGGGGGDTFTDPRDGQVYATIDIGSQIWMAENLNYHTSSSWCYDDDDVNCAIYGRLYDWDAALSACPLGWHLPSDDEWGLLEDYLGGSNIAGGKMKEVGTAHWNFPNTGATNTSGFEALPGGKRNNYTGFSSKGTQAMYWSNSSISSFGWYRYLIYEDENLHRSFDNKEDALSIRCLKD